MVVVDAAAIAARLAKGDEDGSSAGRGKALEEAVADLWGAIPGLAVTEMNALNAAGSEEIDVVFFNDQERDGLWFVDEILIVECKNWSGRVSADQVNSFKTKLQRRQRRIGVLVAANGLTGAYNPPSAAYDSVQAALREGVEILVVTRAEMESVTDTDELCALMKQRRVELAAFGTARLK